MSKVSKLIKVLILLGLALFIISPLVYTVFTSLKTKTEYFVNPFGISFTPTFDNYINIAKNFGIWEKLFNTFLVVSISMLGILLFGIPIAYFVNKISSPYLRQATIFCCFIFMFIPEEVFIFIEYNMMSDLGLVNNFLSVILIYISSSLPEIIFFLSIFFDTIPKAIKEAAYLDGVDDYDYLLKIVIPIAKSPIIVVSITTMISLWNTFLVPLIFLYEDEKKLITPALAGLITKHSTNPTYQMAGIVISIVPLLITYIVFKKRIFENTLGGAIK